MWNPFSHRTCKNFLAKGLFLVSAAFTVVELASKPGTNLNSLLQCQLGEKEHITSLLDTQKCDQVHKEEATRFSTAVA